MADEIKDKLQSTVDPEIAPVPETTDALGKSTDTEPEVSTQGSDAEAAPKDVKDEPASAPEADKKDEPFVWDGGVDNLPKELQGRGKGMLDHMHKVTQEAAQVKREADAYTELTNHPEFQDFLKWQENKKDSLPPAGPPSPELTEEDLLAAQTDPQAFSSLLNKGINSAIQPLAEQVMKELKQLKYDNALGKRERELESFGQTHKDFWDIDTRIMKAVIEDVVVKNNGTLEDAYKQAKLLDKQYLEKAQSNLNDKIKTKKAAVTASPSKPGEPEIIYVDNSKEATRVAFENAQAGKRVDVRVRRKKT